MANIIIALGLLTNSVMVIVCNDCVSRFQWIEVFEADFLLSHFETKGLILPMFTAREIMTINCTISPQHETVFIRKQTSISKRYR